MINTAGRYQFSLRSTVIACTAMAVAFWLWSIIPPMSLLLVSAIGIWGLVNTSDGTSWMSSLSRALLMCISMLAVLCMMYVLVALVPLRHRDPSILLLLCFVCTFGATLCLRAYRRISVTETIIGVGLFEVVLPLIILLHIELRSWLWAYVTMLLATGVCSVAPVILGLVVSVLWRASDRTPWNVS